MPEGDTLHRAAARVGSALAGEVLTGVDGSHRAVRAERRRLLGATVDDVAAIGKHLVIHASSGWTLRTHLGMTGTWRTYAPDEPWRTSAGKARVVLRTTSAVAVCFAAPHVELAPTAVVMQGLERLGPDLALPDPDQAIILERARRSPASTIADLMLDQGVAAGVGNVYKSEILFLERRHPDVVPSDLDDGSLLALYRRGNRLLRANLADSRRTTTGNRGRQRTWVYGRAGQPCRRCGEIIRSTTHGPLDRLTYWCPACQRA